MCGIAGVIGQHTDRQRCVRRMAAQMAHRGPDGQRFWSGGATSRVVLGHCRLAILDLSELGAQPMLDTSGRHVVTCNGEIYNYLEIRDELKSAGATFRSQSDTEVLIEAYKRWGVECA